MQGLERVPAVLAPEGRALGEQELVVAEEVIAAEEAGAAWSR